MSRAEMQDRNRAKVLVAARAEFLSHGYRDAKVDRIAERAELTRGAVYSNFPSKRALYFAVLAEEAERAKLPSAAGSAGTPWQALGAFARAWVDRLPLAYEPKDSATRLGVDLLPEVLADARMRLPFAQLMHLSAILLGMSLERPRRKTRLVRVAEAALTTLYGASQLAAAAPGFVDEFTIVAACEQLADLERDDVWEAPHGDYLTTVRPVEAPWEPPQSIVDQFRSVPVTIAGNGVVAILGLHRLSTVEDLIRAAPQSADLTIALVTNDPAELMPLVRLVLADLRACLVAAVPTAAWPRLRIGYDESRTIATAAGVTAVSDATETAIVVKGGRIVARADGFGAGLAAAQAA